MEPFIYNHQFNGIKRHTDFLQREYNSATDRKVLDAVIHSTEGHVAELLGHLTDEQSGLITPLFKRLSKVEYEQKLDVLSPYTIAFPTVAEAAIKKLFPKAKKLKLPDFSTIDVNSLTYLGWIDIATTKLYMVYVRNEKLVGIECRYTITNKKSVCSLCNSYGQVALVTAIAKTKGASSPDYYKAVGNYMCVDSVQCNKQITDITSLEAFIGQIFG